MKSIVIEALASTLEDEERLDAAFIAEAMAQYKVKLDTPLEGCFRYKGILFDIIVKKEY